MIFMSLTCLTAAEVNVMSMAVYICETLCRFRHFRRFCRQKLSRRPSSVVVRRNNHVSSQQKSFCVLFQVVVVVVDPFFRISF